MIVGRASRGAPALLCLLLAATPGSAATALPGAERNALRAYLDALVHARYVEAFARLSGDERRYFGSARNYASGFAADRFSLRGYRLLGSEVTPKGTVVLVSERVEFYDHARGTVDTAIASTPYVVVRRTGGLAIRDPGHPWRAFVPSALSAEAFGVPRLDPEDLVLHRQDRVRRSFRESRRDGRDDSSVRPEHRARCARERLPPGRRSRPRR